MIGMTALRLFALASLFASTSPVAIAQDAPRVAGQGRGKLLVTRQDLAELVQELDAALAGPLVRGEMTGEALRAANQRFDRLSLQFFGGDLAAVHGALGAWVQELTGEAPDPSPLRVDVASGGGFTTRTYWSFVQAAGNTLTARVRAVRPWPERAGTRSSATLALSPPMLEKHLAPVTLAFDAEGRLVPLEVEVPHTPGVTEDTTLDLFEPSGAGAASDPPRTLAQATVWRRSSLAAVRAEVEAQLASASASETTFDEASLRVLRARLALLVDAPSPARSREFLLATPELAAAIRNEATRLCAGERPYRAAPEDLWRTVAHGRRDLALRVYMPNVLRLEPWPLVVAFHGAGGDENFLFELGGDGFLKQLADQHGFVVACPLTADFALSAPAFDALLAGLAADYPLDLGRVFLFGHSMGAGAVSNLCRLRPDAIAKAVCVAGFSGVEAESPPVLVLAGELDPIAPPSRLTRAVDGARAKGAKVAFEVLPDQGHTLLLPTAMRRAAEFWTPD